MGNVDNMTTNLKECSEEVHIDVVESLISSLSVELYTVCIFRVFEKHRKSKEEAYTPRVVSVGPLHHGKNHLQAMEAHKKRYLQGFIDKFGISIDKLVKYAAKMEASVRGCYEDTSQFKSKEFSKMILLDGIFVVQLFVKNLVPMRELGDMLFENQWMASDLNHDMLLLENQLPLNFIMGLFEFIDSSRVHQKSFHELSFDYFKGVLGNTDRLKLVDGYEHSRHLVEFLAILHRPNRETGRNGLFGYEYTRSASELHAAGVRFGIGMGDLFDASFRVESGLLILPQLTVNDKTETFFRNLIAYEQCGHYRNYITSYIIFMGSLINTAEDVDLLVKLDIIINSLGQSKLVANLFNKLYKEVKEEQTDFYFAKILDDLDDYSEGRVWNMLWFRWKCRWLSWKSILMENYFNNPWSILSFVAATIVVVLTIVQTVWAIWGPKK